mmetsp:Transcript_35631/g.72256  ORF Transcript_35631/g.72256 Transcript_35631/m.72256 type:complete len:110 (-) Transcript_35631:38-367(-)
MDTCHQRRCPMVTCGDATKATKFSACRILDREAMNVTISALLDNLSVGNTKEAVRIKVYPSENVVQQVDRTVIDDLLARWVVARLYVCREQVIILAGSIMPANALCIRY